MPKLLELAHLVHYVYTPILFLPKWRYEAHSTRLRIKSEVIDSEANFLLPSLSESGEKKLRFSSNEEREHLSVLKSYIGDYLRYLQHSGFSRIKITQSSSRKSSENDKNIFFNKAKSRPRRSTGAGGSSSTGEKNLRKAYV